jgi:hypothetical protein
MPRSVIPIELLASGSWLLAKAPCGGIVSFTPYTAEGASTPDRANPARSGDPGDCATRLSYAGEGACAPLLGSNALP